MDLAGPPDVPVSLRGERVWLCGQFGGQLLKGTRLCFARIVCYRTPRSEEISRLSAYLEESKESVPTLSNLHTDIRAEFNEYIVQIMSPHYIFDPGEKVWVPREK